MPALPVLAPPLAPAPPTFVPWSAAHALIVIACIGLTLSACALAHYFAAGPGGPRARRRFDTFLGALGVAHWLAYALFALTRAGADLQYAIPLQVCDLVSLTAPLAWILHSRRLSVITYFAGFGLSTQAFIQPVVTEGPASPAFWFFFFAHTFIVGGAIYEVAARNLRPTWSDFRFALSVAWIYFLITFATNLATHMNFGYTGNVPGKPNPAALLGPWPLRVVWIVALTHLALFAPMLPWVIARRLTAPRA